MVGYTIQFITDRKRFQKHVSWLVKGNGSVTVPWGPCTHPHRTQARVDLLLNQILAEHSIIFLEREGMQGL